jgi:hypothetical protein
VVSVSCGIGFLLLIVFAVGSLGARPGADYFDITEIQMMQIKVLLCRRAPELNAADVWLGYSDRLFPEFDHLVFTCTRSNLPMCLRDIYIDVRCVVKNMAVAYSALHTLMALSLTRFVRFLNLADGR